MLISNSTV